MKKYDEYGLPLCQEDCCGIQCEGHAGHGPQHFAEAESNVLIWVEPSVYPINGPCC